MNNDIRKWPLAKMYPYLVEKAELKGKTKAEVDQIYCWLTGHTQESFEKQLASDVEYGAFFDNAPQINPNQKLITGVICGIRVEDVQDPTMQNLRYLDKLVDELVKGKPMEKILRKE